MGVEVWEEVWEVWVWVWVWDRMSETDFGRRDLWAARSWVAVGGSLLRDEEEVVEAVEVVDEVDEVEVVDEEEGGREDEEGRSLDRSLDRIVWEVDWWRWREEWNQWMSGSGRVCGSGWESGRVGVALTASDV